MNTEPVDFAAPRSSVPAEPQPLAPLSINEGERLEAPEVPPPIDANELERMAKERPGDCFLMGSGVLKLIAAIRQLEKRLRDIAGLVQWDEYGATGPTIDGLSWESIARMACDLARAPVSPTLGAARPLTTDEILRALCAELSAGVKHTPHEIVQIAFCKVNGIQLRGHGDVTDSGVSSHDAEGTPASNAPNGKEGVA